jgi:hypothetical protein
MSTRTRSNQRAPRLAFVALTLAAFAALTPSPAHADDDAMAPYRERFKAGMERYKVGDLPTAIAGWESIYREVGAEKGYRVAFDLAHAYEKSGDEAHARERYVSFLQIVDQRRAAGLTLEGIVLQEETEARARVAQIRAAPAPLETTATPPPSAAPAPSPPPAPVPAPPPVPASAPLSPLSTANRAPSFDPPFSPVLPLVAGGVTVIAIAVAIVAYTDALSQENAFRAAAGQQVSVQTGLKSSYDGTVPLAYGALGTSIGLAAITTGLTVWYFAGTKKREPTITPAFGAMPGGAEASLVGRF